MLAEFLLATAIVVGTVVWIALLVMFGFAVLDSDDAPIAIRIVAGIFFLLLWIIPVTVFIDYENHQPPHGSCQYEHWIGKTYECDQYYPLPQVRNN